MTEMEFMERIFKGMGELKAEIVGVNTSLQGLANHVAAQNGRVGKLEDRAHEVERRLLREDGIAEGKRAIRQDDRARAAFALKVFNHGITKWIAGGTALAAAFRLWPW